MLNDHESQFSQAKLELYGLYRALGALQLYLIGVRNLIIEVNARYIKGMLLNSDIAPSASINRWIILILTFHFTLVHVTGTHHGPDGLSRCPPQDEDDQFDNKNDFGDWIDHLHGFIHQINPITLGAGHNTPDGVLCKYAGSIPNTVKILAQKYVASMLIVDYHTSTLVTCTYCNCILNVLAEK
ncbi:hypothetical protein L208DRAFT_1557887 [Tricholoma matsutake]|nr:hypothetical protein L208DRAFT_1557887 [Tricholoma matsutake 945]